VNPVSIDRWTTPPLEEDDPVLGELLQPAASNAAATAAVAAAADLLSEIRWEKGIEIAPL
jgi:hypothetical protein